MSNTTITADTLRSYIDGALDSAFPAITQDDLNKQASACGLDSVTIDESAPGLEPDTTWQLRYLPEGGWQVVRIRDGQTRARFYPHGDDARADFSRVTTFVFARQSGHMYA